MPSVLITGAASGIGAGLAVLALACASACARPSAEPGDVVHVQAAPKPATLLHPKGYRYFGMLRQKLRWTERAS